MKKLIALALFLLPFSALADHYDVIQFQLKEGCTLGQYLAIVKDFNDNWADDYGYKAEVAVPLQSENQDSMYWLGRSASAQAFGEAWDVWRDAQSDPNSVPAKLQARFDACGEDIITRRSYDVYTTD